MLKRFTKTSTYVYETANNVLMVMNRFEEIIFSFGYVWLSQCPVLLKLSKINEMSARFELSIHVALVKIYLRLNSLNTSLFLRTKFFVVVVHSPFQWISRR